jgi:hypothetical protein
MIELKREYKVEGCVGDPQTKEGLSQPFFTGRHIYATNGHILACVPVKAEKADIPGRLDGELLSTFRKQVRGKHQDVVFGLGDKEQVQPFSGLKGPRPAAVDRNPLLGTIIKNARHGRPGEGESIRVKIDPWALVKLAEGIGVDKKGGGVELNLHFQKKDENAKYEIEVRPLNDRNKAFGIMMPLR